MDIDIDQYIIKIDLIITSLENLEWGHNLDPTITLVTQEEHKWLLAEALRAKKDIQDFKSSLTSQGKRNKRGLINAVGHGLKFLFGTATVKDIDKLNNKWQELENEGQLMHHLVEEQATLL